MERALLLKSVSAVAPALSDNDLVPAFGCFYFRKGRLCAYNNAIGISVPTEFPVKAGGVDGPLFMNFLKHSSAAEIKVTPDEDNVSLSCGRSRIKLRLLSKSEFSFKQPKTKSATHLELDEIKQVVFQQCLERTAISIGIDPGRPEHLGVLLEFSDEGVTMYATDNFTAARTRLSMDVPEELQGTALCIPPEAVKALLRVDASMFASIFVEKGWMMFRSPEGYEVFSRTMAQADASTYHNVFGSQDWESKKGWLALDEEFGPAITRATLLASDTVFTKFSISKGSITMETKGRGSDILDEVPAKGKGSTGTIRINPRAVERCLAHVSYLRLIPDFGLCLRGDGYSQIISTVAEE